MKMNVNVTKNKSSSLSDDISYISSDNESDISSDNDYDFSLVDWSLTDASIPRVEDTYHAHEDDSSDTLRLRLWSYGASVDVDGLRNEMSNLQSDPLEGFIQNTACILCSHVAFYPLLLEIASEEYIGSSRRFILIAAIRRLIVLKAISTAKAILMRCSPAVITTIFWECFQDDSKVVVNDSQELIYMVAEATLLSCKSMDFIMDTLRNVFTRNIVDVLELLWQAAIALSESKSDIYFLMNFARTLEPSTICEVLARPYEQHIRQHISYPCAPCMAMLFFSTDIDYSCGNGKAHVPMSTMTLSGALESGLGFCFLIEHSSSIPIRIFQCLVGLTADVAVSIMEHVIERIFFSTRWSSNRRDECFRSLFFKGCLPDLWLNILNPENSGVEEFLLAIEETLLFGNENDGSLITSKLGCIFSVLSQPSLSLRDKIKNIVVMNISYTDAESLLCMDVDSARATCGIHNHVADAIHSVPIRNISAIIGGSDAVVRIAGLQWVTGLSADIVACSWIELNDNRRKSDRLSFPPSIAQAKLLWLRHSGMCCTFTAACWGLLQNDMPVANMCCGLNVNDIVRYLNISGQRCSSCGKQVSLEPVIRLGVSIFPDNDLMASCLVDLLRSRNNLSELSVETIVRYTFCSQWLVARTPDCAYEILENCILAMERTCSCETLIALLRDVAGVVSTIPLCPSLAAAGTLLRRMRSYLVGKKTYKKLVNVTLRVIGDVCSASINGVTAALRLNVLHHLVVIIAEPSQHSSNVLNALLVLDVLLEAVIGSTVAPLIKLLYDKLCTSTSCNATGLVRSILDAIVASSNTAQLDIRNVGLACLARIAGHFSEQWNTAVAASPSLFNVVLDVCAKTQTLTDDVESIHDAIKILGACLAVPSFRSLCQLSVLGKTISIFVSAAIGAHMTPAIIFMFVEHFSRYSDIYNAVMTAWERPALCSFVKYVKIYRDQCNNGESQRSAHGDTVTGTQWHAALSVAKYGRQLLLSHK